jgi:RsiW-degrading membrane proteinase PrsW (M82 family)
MGVLGFAPIHLHEQVDDKVLHFSIFFILAVLLYFLWNLSVNRNMILATTILLVLAVGSEFIQGLLPVRYLYTA